MNARILSRLLCQPWAIRPLELAAFTQLVLAGELKSTHVRTEEKRRLGPAQTASASAFVIPIWGVIGRAWEWYETEYLGAVDVDDIMSEISATPAGSTVVLWFRSPGGIITGVQECAAFLRQASRTRTIIAFCDELCCSAAYWLASQCQVIIVTPSAMVGSIGVYIAMYDFTDYLAKAGVSLELFKAGRLKAMGLPGNPLSDEEGAFLQASVDDGYELFTADVLRNRDLDVETMQGQAFSGSTVLDLNLADAFAPSYAVFQAALASGKYAGLLAA